MNCFDNVNKRMSVTIETSEFAKGETISDNLSLATRIRFYQSASLTLRPAGDLYHVTDLKCFISRQYTTTPVKQYLVMYLPF